MIFIHIPILTYLRIFHYMCYLQNSIYFRSWSMTSFLIMLFWFRYEKCLNPCTRPVFNKPKNNSMFFIQSLLFNNILIIIMIYRNRIYVIMKKEMCILTKNGWYITNTPNYKSVRNQRKCIDSSYLVWTISYQLLMKLNQIENNQRIL